MVDQRSARRGRQGNAMSGKHGVQRRGVRFQGSGDHADLVESVCMGFHKIQNRSTGDRQFLLGPDDALDGCLRQA